MQKTIIEYIPYWKGLLIIIFTETFTLIPLKSYVFHILYLHYISTTSRPTGRQILKTI